MTKNEVAIRVNDIHKEFILPQSKSSSFKQAAVNIVKKNNKVTQKTLDGVSFEISKGDFFGIVGRNGSGKSTLLKLIAGVYTPTKGSIDINGGLTPFIELGVGFNPELSGRDNVYLNGALLGFNRKQMDEMYDDIVEFAELEPFMGQKLKNYSSGMQVRLAFSIAVKAKNDILIFDEVLAVGDEAFQRKCLDVFEKYKADKQTVILVSHDMETVRRFCNRTILIKDGKIVNEGDPRKIAEEYSRINQEVIDKNELLIKSNNDSSGLEVSIKDKHMKPIASFISGNQFRIEVKWKNNIDIVVVNIFKNSGEHITAFRVYTTKSNKKEFVIKLSPRFGTGKYRTFIEMRNKDNKDIYPSQYGPSFIITEQDPSVPIWSGVVYVDHEVEIK